MTAAACRVGDKRKGYPAEIRGNVLVSVKLAQISPADFEANRFIVTKARRNS